jgi:hypothetical protein
MIMLPASSPSLRSYVGLDKTSYLPCWGALRVRAPNRLPSSSTVLHAMPVWAVQQHFGISFSNTALHPASVLGGSSACLNARTLLPLLVPRLPALALAGCRVCRRTVKTEQLDVIPDPYWSGLADKAVQAGLVQFPDSAFLNVVYASLQAVLLNDPSVREPGMMQSCSLAAL